MSDETYFYAAPGSMMRCACGHCLRLEGTAAVCACGRSYENLTARADAQLRRDLLTVVMPGTCPPVQPGDHAVLSPDVTITASVSDALAHEGRNLDVMKWIDIPTTPPSPDKS